ncbi:MAG: DNA methyltransferase [Desulfurellaceae bacterium]|nr:DNA methyltransferase [Desulfurellaceae bacterium]
MSAQQSQRIKPSPEESAAFGQRLREERQATGRSLSDLAKALQVTKGYLSRLERGKAKPSKGIIESIAHALKIDPGPLKVLAGDLPDDVRQILYHHPEDAPTLLRETFGEYGSPAPARKSDNSAKSIPQKKQRREPLQKELYELIQADCFDWLEHRAPDSIHAVVTDPPYGLKEYTSEEKQKLRRGRGGVWRIPPALNGYTRSPLPRFTVLTHEEKDSLQKFFAQWAIRIQRVLVPGGHVFIATNPLLSHLIYTALEEAGFEKRGEIIRLVQTLRGGDRPKNAHKEFENVTVMPRSCWEPWGLFRKPCRGRVQDNLRKWKTGGLRRLSEEQPFGDVIKSAPTRGIEREIASHPSLKPQAFMRQIVRAALPLGEGIILDPFMGGGATIAAASVVGYRSIGIEMDQEYYKMAVQAIPKLATLDLDNGKGPSHLSRGHADRQPALFS